MQIIPTSMPRMIQIVREKYNNNNKWRKKKGQGYTIKNSYYIYFQHFVCFPKCITIQYLFDIYIYILFNLLCEYILPIVNHWV